MTSLDLVRPSSCRTDWITRVAHSIQRAAHLTRRPFLGGLPLRFVFGKAWAPLFFSWRVV